MTEPLEHRIELAAIGGDVLGLMQLVDEVGPAVVRQDDDPDELTTLHLAAAAGQLGVVHYLLSPAVGSEAGAGRKNNFHPLHAAAMRGHAEVCEALLGAGAEVNVQTRPQGYTPLHSAAFGGHVDAIGILLLYGADRGLRNHRGETPADLASRRGHEAAVVNLEAE